MRHQKVVVTSRPSPPPDPCTTGLSLDFIIPNDSTNNRNDTEEDCKNTAVVGQLRDSLRQYKRCSVPGLAGRHSEGALSTGGRIINAWIGANKEVVGDDREEY
eukprot:gene20638-biopygen6849